MLYAEFDRETAKEVWQEEAREQDRKEIAKKALKEGVPLETVVRFSGLDTQTVQQLASTR